MQILWHRKIAVTTEIYTEVPSTASREALKKLGQWLGTYGLTCRYINDHAVESLA
jgi:hypothetical protein